jgi:hypothetical protein
MNTKLNVMSEDKVNYQVAPQATQKSYDFPTEVISLPSEGRCYPETHPLSKGTVTIKYMTAREEDILASQSLIKKGIVMDKLLESLVVDVPLDDIIIGDKNAIFLAARVLGYGPQYDVEVTDPFSGNKQKVSIDLSKVKTKDIDFDKLNRKNEYEFELPLSKKKIKFKLLTHKDEREITEELQALEKINKNAVTSDITVRLRKMIVEVDGKTDRAFITKWINNEFLARDTKALRAYVKTITPDLDLKFQFTSDETGETEALDIPFGVSFFYPTT